MKQCYRHFDHKERTLIYWWRKEHLSLREIARRLRRSHTSISRELRRNRWCGQSAKGSVRVLYNITLHTLNGSSEFFVLLDSLPYLGGDETYGPNIR
jgi:hypothetical protein